MHARRVREGDQVHLYHVVAPGQYAVLSSDMGVGEVIENEDETARRIVSLTSVQAVLVSQSMQAPAEFGITQAFLSFLIALSYNVAASMPFIPSASSPEYWHGLGTGTPLLAGACDPVPHQHLRAQTGPEEGSVSYQWSNHI